MMHGHKSLKSAVPFSAQIPPSYISDDYKLSTEVTISVRPITAATLNKTHQETITKSKNAHTCIKATYVIHTAYLLHVSASLAVTLREMHYTVSIQ
jgi:hypothetical protein